MKTSIASLSMKLIQISIIIIQSVPAKDQIVIINMKFILKQVLKGKCVDITARNILSLCHLNIRSMRANLWSFLRIWNMIFSNRFIGNLVSWLQLQPLWYWWLYLYWSSSIWKSWRWGWNICLGRRALSSSKWHVWNKWCIWISFYKNWWGIFP